MSIKWKAINQTLGGWIAQISSVKFCCSSISPTFNKLHVLKNQEGTPVWWTYQSYWLLARLLLNTKHKYWLPDSNVKTVGRLSKGSLPSVRMQNKSRGLRTGCTRCGLVEKGLTRAKVPFFLSGIVKSWNDSKARCALSVNLAWPHLSSQAAKFSVSLLRSTSEFLMHVCEGTLWIFS